MCDHLYSQECTSMKAQPGITLALVAAAVGLLASSLPELIAKPLAPVPKDLKGPKELKLDLGNEVTMEFVRVPKGMFRMGSPEDEEGRDQDETQHEVAITKDFYLGKLEVNRSQFKQFVKDARYDAGPEWRRNTQSSTDAQPVNYVNWEDATAFCKWLADKTGRPSRLPTEAEWEYACRAGTETRFYSGDGTDGLEEVGNCGKGFSGRTTACGKFRANKFGLCDMHGNVFEWCSDWYGPKYYEDSPKSDPQGPGRGQERVLRGGSFLLAGCNCRSAFRFWAAPSDRTFGYGFRVAFHPS
jgi:formylglycine-generating enzyme required for sulfatase activity